MTVRNFDKNDKPFDPADRRLCRADCPELYKLLSQTDIMEEEINGKRCNNRDVRRSGPEEVA